MNLYLILALALGAISGGTVVPHADRLMAKVVSESGVRAARKTARLSCDRQHRIDGTSCIERLAPRAPRLVTAPLAGAATPRAPARIG